MPKSSNKSEATLRGAFDVTVAQNRQLSGGVDAALVEAGRKIANEIDFAVDNYSGQERTKALYLVPHLMNVLKEMLATPAARQAAGLSVKESAGGKLAQLRPLRTQPTKSA
jgi:hypothetical protein